MISIKPKKLQPTSYKLIIRKSYKILGLSFLILISALVFFFWRGKELLQELKPTPKTSGQFQVVPLSPGFSEVNIVESQTQVKNANLLSPDKFNSFFYDALNPKRKKTLELKIECQDAYYTILIFNIKDDYRQNPGAARFNQAAPCPPSPPAGGFGEASQKREKIKRSIDLENLNLSAGKYYYIIADQGSTGSWYNSR